MEFNTYIVYATKLCTIKGTVIATSEEDAKNKALSNDFEDIYDEEYDGDVVDVI